MGRATTAARQRQTGISEHKDKLHGLLQVVYNYVPLGGGEGYLPSMCGSLEQRGEMNSCGLEKILHG